MHNWSISWKATGARLSAGVYQGQATLWFLPSDLHLLLLKECTLLSVLTQWSIWINDKRAHRVTKHINRETNKIRGTCTMILVTLCRRSGLPGKEWVWDAEDFLGSRHRYCLLNMSSYQGLQDILLRDKCGSKIEQIHQALPNLFWRLKSPLVENIWCKHVLAVLKTC